MPAVSTSKRRSAVATRARKARKWARDGIPRQRIADDLGVSIRTVDAYLAQGRKAAADSVPPKRDMTLDEMKAIEDEVANPRRRKNTALGYIDRDQFRRMNFGGGGFDPPTEWLDRQKVTTRLESDLVRLVSPPGTPVIRRWAEPAQVAALLEEGWTRA